METNLNIYFVYWHKKADTGEIFYIGQGKKKNRENSLGNRNNFWHNTVNKHGFISEILSINLTKERADNLECFLINQLGRKDLNKGPLVNMTDGADGCFNMSPESRLKISLAMKGKFVGEKNPMYGKHFKHTNEAKIKITNTSIGRKHSIKSIEKMSGENNHMYGKHPIISEETKIKISKASQGKIISEEQKIKISNKLKGRTSPMKGRICSAEHIKRRVGSRLSSGNSKMTEEQKIICSKAHNNKKILQFSLNDEFIKEWECIAFIRRDLPELSYAGVLQCCNGYNKTSCGFKWKYKTE